MNLRDRDLISIQEARELVARAVEAQRKFAAFSQEQVDSVVDACAEAATAAAEPLARAAVEETGYGNVADKVTKNLHGSVNVHRAIRGLRTVGIIREDKEKGILEVATPVGVVAAVIPSTNPTSTTIYKTLIALKARNAVILSPHPTAIRCICEAASLLARAASRAGAPEGLIACMQHTTLQGTQELMRHRDVGVILATGGTGLVRAAYSSGKPAYGVGPGNVPAYIERTANVRKAVADIFAGKTFDYGTICSSEQAIVADEAIRDLALEECRRQGAYLLSADEIRRVGELVIHPATQTPNPKIVGRPATTIAELAAIHVPPSTRVLLARLEHVGREHPLSAEKLSPILAFYVVPNAAAAIDLCTRLLQFGGLGHTCAVHSQDEAVIRAFGRAVPAFRVCVNTSAVHGSIGYSTQLFPAMTLGCGALGSNITSDNIGPHHLMNIKRIAWESRPVEHRSVPADQRLAGTAAVAKPAGAVPGPSTVSVIKPAEISSGSSGTNPVIPDRATIARTVEHVLSHLGIPRGGASEEMTGSTGPSVAVPPAEVTATPGGVAAPPAPAMARLEPSQVASEVVARLFPKSAVAPTASAAAPPAQTAAPAPLPKPEVKVVPFVSEIDVRSAITRQEKIFIGPKTIVTPSARDLGVAHEVFVETELRFPSAGKPFRAGS